MSTYDVGRTEIVTNLETSVGAFLTQQILNNLNSNAQTLDEAVTVVSNFKPGDTVAPGTDIVIVQPGVNGGVTVPDGVSAIIFTGPTGVQVSLNTENTTAVQLTTGDDKITVLDNSNTIVFVNAGDGNDTVVGALNSSNAIVGGGGNDSMVGGNKNDSFGMGEGNDTAAGGQGFDQAFVKGSKADFKVAVSDNGTLTLTNSKTASVSSLTGIEVVNFEDGTVLVNTKSEIGFAAASLYEVVLGRAIDTAGYNFFNSVSTEQAVGVANAMLHSNEFTAKFGNVDQMSDQQFLDVMFKTAFDRSADTAGLNYWLGKLAGGMSKGEVALNLAYSGEAQSHFDATIVKNKGDTTLT